MLSLVDRLSNPGHAGFVNGTQVAPGGGGTGAHPSDRATAAIRPVDPAELAALGDFFAGLSVESRHFRFFAPVRPSHGLLDLLAGGPAHVDAIVAVVDGVIVGHAMAADLPERAYPCDGRATDIGVVVADAWQRKGLGATLMRALIARAQARGVTALAMDVLPGNRRALGMILGHWPDAAVGHSPDGLDIRITLPPSRPPDTTWPRDAAMARRPAREQVRPLVPVGG
jgi:GNAT superfamily N-acetyltransferase